VRLRGSSDSSRAGVRRCRHESGTAVVEFALVVPLLLLIVFGILDGARALNYVNDATHLAATGARFAVVNNNPGAADGMTLAEWIKSEGATGEFQDNSTVCIALLGTNQPGQPVEVTVEVDFNWLPFFGNYWDLDFKNSLEGSAVMRLEQTPTAFSDGECSS
jgi:Flp pilus assembly protein TadG